MNQGQSDNDRDPSQDQRCLRAGQAVVQSAKLSAVNKPIPKQLIWTSRCFVLLRLSRCAELAKKIPDKHYKTSYFGLGKFEKTTPPSHQVLDPVKCM